MFSTFPIRMNYVIESFDSSFSSSVDVYGFHVHCGGKTSALCWFVKDKAWSLVDIENLVPVESRSLNE